MNIREATAYDCKKYNDLYRKAFLEPSNSKIFSCDKQISKDFEQTINSDKNIIYFLEEESCIGYAKIEKDKKIWKLKEFVIKKEEQGKGYGKIFYEWIKEKSKQEGAYEIVVYPKNDKTSMFWTRLGLRFLGRGQNVLVDVF